MVAGLASCMAMGKECSGMVVQSTGTAEGQACVQGDGELAAQGGLLCLLYWVLLVGIELEAS